MGFCARALVIALVGVFLVQAAVNFDPDNAGGMAKAFATLMEQPFGRWLLGATASGLIAHGLFIWAMIRYRDLGGNGMRGDLSQRLKFYFLRIYQSTPAASTRRVVDIRG